MRSSVREAKRIVIKIGTTSITYDSGHINLRQVELLARVVSDLRNSGKEIVLVSSGAIGAGMGSMGFSSKPQKVEERQAAAAVGQAILMQFYQKFFREYDQSIAQILLTRDVFTTKIKKDNAVNTFNTLIRNGIVPIVNENDPICTDEIEEERFGDNDTLSAMVSVLVDADLLVILTDVDGLYDCNPGTNKDAKLITYVEKVTDELLGLADGANSKVGTGGMETKLAAARITSRKGIHTILAGSKNLDNIYDVLDGKEVGTFIK